MGIQYNVGGIEEQSGFVTDKALFLNAARTKVVEADDPDASYLLAGIGGHVDEATARRYKLNGLTKVGELENNSDATIPVSSAMTPGQKIPPSYQ